jgi:heavy metal efflux system protein
MFESIIRYSIHHKLIILLFTLGVIGYGIYAIMNIPIGAVPDITNNQVQVITTSRNLATEDIEKFVTTPVELEMANLPGVKEIRSVSKFGLSVVTIVFEDALGTYLPRQLIAEKIKSAEESIPQGFGTPFMGPVSTGLGEIYQYILDVQPAYQDQYSVSDLRTIQDWIVRRQLSGIPGVVEVNTWGGYLKTYEVAVNPQQLKAMDISLSTIFKSLEDNNSVAGGGYIEKTNEAYFIRAEGLIGSIEDIENIVVENRNGIPIYIKDIAKVGFGHATRFGAITGNGEGEKVLGQIMMLKGAAGKKVIDNVKERVDAVQRSLPKGVFINPVLERSELINKTTFTIGENLIFGCLIVIFVVILLLGNIRSGLVVASVIPLCLLFAISLMYLFGVDANLMSLGAIDFGIIIDGAVIIVEYVAFKITSQSAAITALSIHDRKEKINSITLLGTNKMMHSAIFGQLIIIIVFIPILTLTGVEGKMFSPMAMTFCFALIGAMIMCFTYVPVMASLFIKPSIQSNKNISVRLINFLQKLYRPSIVFALRFKVLIMSLALILLVSAGILFSRMGGEFVPTLDEGDFVIQPVLKTGMSLEKTIEMTTRMEKIIKRFPEVNQVVSRIGAAEVPTDPMSMEESDVIITLFPKKQWTSASSKDELADLFKTALEEEIPGVEIEFTQPIEMRFNELITGVRADLAIKLFGPDLNILNKKGLEIKKAIENVKGAADVIIEKTAGLPQMTVKYDRQKIARYGLNISDLNKIISMGFAGMAAGTIFEGEKQFDLVIKYDKANRKDIDQIKNAMVNLHDGLQLPLSTFADIEYATGPAKISRDDTKRRIVVGVNVRGRDLQSVVDDVKRVIDNEVKIPPGYLVDYGGQFENLQSATKRLMVAVPISLVLIFFLLYFAFNSAKDALIIYSAIPLASVGGIFLLYLRDMPFSISAGVGFIALFGIAVLNGIVLIEHFKELKTRGITNINKRIIKGTTERLRPVLLTALAAALGFLPMAISTSAGAEVQKPLATVVIGGLISATLLTLIVLPVLYALFDKKRKPIKMKKVLFLLPLILAIPFLSNSQKVVSLNEAIELAYQNNLGLKTAILEIDKSNVLVGTYKDIPKTDFHYGYDQNNIDENGNALHVIGSSQAFKLPTVYQAQKEVKEAQVDIQKSVVEINKASLAKEVSKAYYAVLYYQELVVAHEFLDSLYQTFELAAAKKYSLGEGNNLEKITAAAKRRNIKSNLNYAQKNQQKAISILKQWMQTDDNIIVSADDEDLQLPMLNLEDHPLIEYQKQLLKRSQMESALSDKQKLPEFNITVFGGLGSVADFKIYPGVQAGISLPLWNKNYKAQAEAAQIDTEIKVLDIANQKIALQNSYEQLLVDYTIYKDAIVLYEDSGKGFREELITTAEKSFKNGEIDYFQYIQSLENAAEIKINFLFNMYMFNQVLIELNYLLN